MNLHDELGRHGADAVDESARRLSSSDVRAALGARVRRGRRRRAVGGGVGAVAGIALVAVGAWSVLPGLGNGTVADPAGVGGDATTYRVSDSAPVEPLPGGPFDNEDTLAYPELMCGDPFELEEGVTVHDASVLDDSWVASASSWALHDDGSHHAAPTGINLGFETHYFRFASEFDGIQSVAQVEVPLLVRDGVVVGVGVAGGGSGGGGSLAVEPGGDDWLPEWTPSPGQCGDEDRSAEFGDGTYEPVWVTRLWTSDVTSPEPLATIVFSAGEIEYSGLGEPEVDDSGLLGNTWGDDALASVIEVREWNGGLECAALSDDQAFVTGTGDAGDVVGSIPVPSTIETGRLYGYGDDALVGGYPIPVNGSEDGTGPISRMVEVGDMRLVLRGVDGMWVFDARWSERDDLPHDEPGWFVELSPVWDCSSPGVVEPGEYSASLVVPEKGDVYDLTSITVVDGVPSIPELHEG
ncbi:hypothetical protein [Demequina aestuarii]|uniref:hypothetical protein n=1 Tax=Demequina aestuarii TaxID=327095 RepID=UPI000781703D|nr:hypothetical protein [Demequina aestuarii]